jgi:hypothetical protein
MLKKIGFGALAVATIGAMSAIAFAGGNQDFSLHNETDFVIDELHISLANDDKWGADVLGKDVLNLGESARITFTGFKDTDCKFDVKIKKVKEDVSYVVEDIDLCEIDKVSFTSKDGKVLFHKE